MIGDTRCGYKEPPNIEDCLEWLDEIKAGLTRRGDSIALEDDARHYEAIRAILEQQTFIRTRCDAIAFDVNDLATANGSMGASSQRELAKYINQRLAEIYKVLPPLPKEKE